MSSVIGKRRRVSRVLRPNNNEEENAMTTGGKKGRFFKDDDNIEKRWANSDALDEERKTTPTILDFDGNTLFTLRCTRFLS